MRFKIQFVPLFLTVLTFLALCIILFLFLHLLNMLPLKEKIVLALLPLDIFVGLFIYLKTSIDFALFIARVMRENMGWKKRIAIELGTALGNSLGTLVVLGIWFLFKQAGLLMVLMIFFAALVLLQMAEDGLGELQEVEKGIDDHSRQFFDFSLYLLHTFNTIFRPVIRWVLPKRKIRNATPLPFWRLLFFSLTVPFILGLDDFAGYISLFTIVNVFSFCVGIFFGHMLLNIGLFAIPDITVRITKHPLVLLSGSLAFIGIAIFGLYDALHIFISFF